MNTKDFTPYRFVQLCASEEGYDASGKVHNIPTDRNNPMDLRHSPHSSHFNIDPNGIGEIDTIKDGFDDANRQSEVWAKRGLDLYQTIYDLAPPSDNDTDRYLNFLCIGLELPSWTLMSDVLKVPSI